MEAEECCAGRDMESVGCIEILYAFGIPSANKLVIICTTVRPQVGEETYAILHDRGKAISCWNFAHLKSKDDTVWS